jgi:hypothetical protein
MSLTLTPILSQINAVQTPQTHFSKIHFNISLQFTPRCFKEWIVILKDAKGKLKSPWNHRKMELQVASPFKAFIPKP